MLVGAQSLAGPGGGTSNFHGVNDNFDLQDGFIPYGSVIIDQRTLSQKNCLDYMTDWCFRLDVQTGANFKGADVFEQRRRVITTPRDLATYVHFDALSEACLNACLIMLGLGVPASRCFPEPSPSGRRDAFATFGGPHILSLVTEVATRCLRAVRRQKFNYHRRARPEALGERLTIQGELDKLAANISIGRNMAGVHYYSDYYDSLRMGERIAVGILLEQAPTYGDAVESTFKSFDGDYVTLSSEAGSAPALSVIDRDGSPVAPRDWWLRHVPDQELMEDLQARRPLRTPGGRVNRQGSSQCVASEIRAPCSGAADRA